jgi:hypothetical protein
VGGDWQCINSEEELEQVILYANEGQDRKGDPQDSMHKAVYINRRVLNPSTD